MKAITTKHLGFTNTKPSRIKASAEGVKPITYSRETLSRYGKDPHREAAERFCFAQGWERPLASGGTGNPDVWVHCFVPAEASSALQYEAGQQSKQLAIAAEEKAQLVQQLNTANRRITELENEVAELYRAEESW